MIFWLVHCQFLAFCFLGKRSKCCVSWKRWKWSRKYVGCTENLRNAEEGTLRCSLPRMVRILRFFASSGRNQEFFQTKIYKIYIVGQTRWLKIITLIASHLYCDLQRSFTSTASQLAYLRRNPVSQESEKIRSVSWLQQSVRTIFRTWLA